eukprot:2164831-Amphidinium_carterae.1
MSFCPIECRYEDGKYVHFCFDLSSKHFETNMSKDNASCASDSACILAAMPCSSQLQIAEALRQLG